MYNTSAEYKTATAALYKESKIVGSISDVGITLDDDIVKDLYYDNQCIEEDEDINIGACYTGELGFALSDSIHPVSSFIGNRVTVSYMLKTGENTWETVPLGEFTVVDKSNRKSAGEVSIVAYDDMMKFDVPPDKHIVTGTPAELLETICNICGVVFGGIADGLPNQSVQLVYDMSFYDKYIATMRDVVKFICQILCGFGTIGRDGEFYVRRFTTDPALEIDSDDRISIEISESDLSISGVCTDLNHTILGTTQVIQYPATPDSGKILQLPANPFFEQMSSSVRNTVVRAIAEESMLIAYKPTLARTYGDPSIDIGDYITYTGYIAGDGKTSLVTQNHWRHKGEQEIKCTADMDAGVYIMQMEHTDANDYEYDIVSDEYVRIIRYIGTKPRIILPTTIENLPVKQLLEGSFTGTCVIRVSIPDGVEVIR